MHFPLKNLYLSFLRTYKSVKPDDGNRVILLRDFSFDIQCVGVGRFTLVVFGLSQNEEHGRQEQNRPTEMANTMWPVLSRAFCK